MDPASAAVAFVGFASSVASLAGVVISGLKTLYEAKEVRIPRRAAKETAGNDDQQLKSAPEDFDRLCRTIQTHESLLVEIKNRSIIFDSSPLISAQSKQLWTDSIKNLEDDLAEITKMRTKMDSVGHVTRSPLPKIKKAAKLFFSEKKMNQYMSLLERHVQRLTFMHSLIDSSQKAEDGRTQRLEIHQGFELVNNELVLAKNATVSEIRRLGDRFTQFEMNNLQHTQLIKQDLIEATNSASNQLLLNIKEELALKGYIQEEATAFRGRRQRQNSELRKFLSSWVCRYRTPFGFLEYIQHPSESGRDYTQSVSLQPGKLVRFIPARWLSKYVIQLAWWPIGNAASSWKYNITPMCVRICDDPEVLESLGLSVCWGEKEPLGCRCLNYDDHCSRNCPRTLLSRPNPEAIRKFLDSGRLSANDMYLHYNGLDMSWSHYYSVLYGIIMAQDYTIESFSWIRDSYEACKLLLQSGAEVEQYSDKYLDEILESRTSYSAVAQRSELALPKLLEYSIPALLQHHGDPRYLFGIYEACPNIDILYKEYVQFLDPFNIQDLQVPDRWYVGIFCHALPGFAERLKAHMESFSASGIPNEFSIQFTLEEIQGSQLEDQKEVLETLSRYGTADMLRPFVEAGFDMAESGFYHSCLCYAAVSENMDTFKFLLSSGVPLFKDAKEFTNILGTYLIHKNAHDTKFVDVLLKLAPLHDRRFTWSILSHFVARSYFGYLDEEILIYDALVSRGYCSYNHPPYARNTFLSEEIRDIALACTWYTRREDQEKMLRSLGHLALFHKAGLELELIAQDTLSKWYRFTNTIQVMCPSAIGYTPLMFTVYSGQVVAVKILVEAGAKITEKSSSQLSALEVAVKNVAAIHPRKWASNNPSPWTDLVSLQVDEEVLSILLAELERRHGSRPSMSVTDIHQQKSLKSKYEYILMLPSKLIEGVLQSLESIGFRFSIYCRTTFTNHYRYSTNRLTFTKSIFLRFWIVILFIIVLLIELRDILKDRVTHLRPPTLKEKFMLVFVIVCIWLATYFDVIS